MLIEADAQVERARTELEQLIRARDAIAVLAGHPTMNGNGRHEGSPMLTKHGQTQTPGLSAALLELVCDIDKNQPDARFTAIAVYDWLGGRWSISSVRWAIAKLVKDGLIIDTGTVTDPIRSPGSRRARHQTIFTLKGADQ